MPRTTNTRRAKAAPKPQTTPKAEQAPAPTGDTSLFDDTPPAPPAAEQQPVDPAASSEPSDAAPNGDGDTQQDDSADDAPASSADPAPADPATGGGDPSVGPEEVRLGQAIGLLHRLPLEDVLACAEPFANKIEALTHTAPVQDLLPRMRASEGRCAPIYFTGDDDDEPEHLIAGDDALSAAKAIGLETVFVVIVHAGDAGAVQSYLAEQANKPKASTEDDDLVWRSNGYHTDR